VGNNIYEQSNFDTREKSALVKKHRRWPWFLIIAVLIVGVIGAIFYKASYTFSQISVNTSVSGGVLPLNDNVTMPVPDPNRLNILLLGLRGEGDPNGGLLTDSIMVVSIEKLTGKVALLSIPRDLYVTMPGTTDKQKINFAYALGFEKKGAAGALFMSETIVSRVTGLYIDHAISVDHAAFKEIVDILGGIDIHLNKPFIEDQQWIDGGDAGPSWAFSIKTYTATSTKSLNATSTPAVITTQKWVFEIPAGNSHLDGNTALYFTRARYSSNDFDRVARQQQVLLAIKDKALTLDVLSNPIKLFSLMDSLGKNIKMDMTTSDVSNLLSLYPNLNTKNVIHKVFDVSSEGLLYASKANDGAYILLPVGENYDKIQAACKNIFSQ